MLEPKEIWKEKVSYPIELDKIKQFYQRGLDYCIDGYLIDNLYDLYKNKKNHVYVMSHSDKVEVVKAYPGLFNYKQENHCYKITKNI